MWGIYPGNDDKLRLPAANNGWNGEVLCPSLTDNPHVCGHVESIWGDQGFGQGVDHTLLPRGGGVQIWFSTLQNNKGKTCGVFQGREIQGSRAFPFPSSGQPLNHTSNFRVIRIQKVRHEPCGKWAEASRTKLNTSLCMAWICSLAPVVLVPFRISRW